MTISSIDCNKVDPTTWALSGSGLDCYKRIISDYFGPGTKMHCSHLIIKIL